MEEMLSKRNQRDAFNHFSMKKNGRGVDGMQISELEDYWKINHEQIEADLLAGNYQLGIVKSYEMIDGRGKRRVICSLNAIDRFVARLLAQKLRRYMEPEFCENSFAYQEGKGVAAAVEKACQYINEGYTIVAEMDIESYFDKIYRKYLNHVQKSVFDGAITEGQLRRLKNELQQWVVPEEDTVCIYYLASSKYAGKEQIGTVLKSTNNI